MPSTYGQIQSKNPELGAIEQPEWNIAAGISHARAMWRVWRGRVVPEDRRTFMFGSYNAGRSPIARAQDLAAASAFDPRLWASIEAVAPRVQGWRHQETLGYVRKIDVNLARLDPHGRLMRRR
jgi:membrane-bound lytic murein transglycosylase MltF